MKFDTQIQFIKSLLKGREDVFALRWRESKCPTMDLKSPARYYGL